MTIQIITLTNKKLKDHLHRINTDPNTRDMYNSKVNRVMNFLRRTSGFKIAGIKEGGSRGGSNGGKSEGSDF